MKKLIEKLRKIERSLSEEKGPFLLFALFLRDDAPGVWDLVAAADWIDKDRVKALREIGTLLQDKLSVDELVMLARIVLIETNNKGLRAISRVVAVEHGLVELRENEFFGLEIKRAYVITSDLQKKTAKVEA